MAEFGREELRRLTVGLKEFVNFQQRLGLQLVEGVYPVQGSKPVPFVGTDDGAEAAPEPPVAMSLEEIREEMGDCRRCKLWQSRTRLVFGVGDPKARLMFIGEAPGAEEDKQGEPFVGEAGNLLNNLFHKLELSRQEVYITNVVKSRPPHNRTPVAEEITACRPFLLKQIQAIRPQIIVTLGAVAINALLDAKEPLHRLRGKWQKWQGMAVMPTFHPAYLLRNPRAKFDTWDDMQKVMAVYRPKESDKSE
jgi:uracil-DNA glycosylase